MAWTFRSFVASLFFTGMAPAQAGEGPGPFATLSPTWTQSSPEVWRGTTVAGDAVVVRHLADGAPLDDGAGVRALLTLGKGASPLEQSGFAANNVWIFAVPQEPSGITYVGALRSSGASGAWQLEVTCVEVGTTGMREALLLDRALGDGSVDLSGGRIKWKVPPDDVRYDKEFPKHPLSRLRAVFAGVLGAGAPPAY